MYLIIALSSCKAHIFIFEGGRKGVLLSDTARHDFEAVNSTWGRSNSIGRALRQEF